MLSHKHGVCSVVDGAPEIVGAHEIIFFFWDRDVGHVIEIALRDLRATPSLASSRITSACSSRVACSSSGGLP
jgi:hypothetical protein